MNTRILFFILFLLLVLPWLPVLMSSTEIVGMSARDEHVVYPGDSDVYDCAWHVHWVHTALREGNDPRVYSGLSLAWHNMGWPDLFISLITGNSYDLMLMFGALFSAFTGFLLARSWGVGKSGSLIAGFIVAWMPVRLIRMYQHYPIASIGYVLASMLFIRNWTLNGGKKNFILLILFSCFAVLESLYHGITIAFGWMITSFLMGRKYVRRSMITGVLAGAGCLLGSLWFFTAPGALELNPGKDWKEAVFWAAEPQSFFLPSFAGNPLILDYMPNDFEGVVSPGATVAILALLYCWKKRSWKALAAVLGIVILSMGPLFKINAIPTALPLPYMVLVKLPWLSAARAPSRLAILIGIMSAIAAGAFIERRKAKSAWLLTGLILLEIVPFGVRSIEATVPHFYRTDAASGITLEIPSSEMIRRYSLFSIADSSPRIVKFLARGGEQQMLQIPETLKWGSTSVPSQADMVFTGADIVVYNRWMFSDSIRTHYDLLYEDLFSDQEKGDSVWVWTLI